MAAPMAKGVFLSLLLFAVITDSQVPDEDAKLKNLQNELKTEAAVPEAALDRAAVAPESTEVEDERTDSDDNEQVDENNEEEGDNIQQDAASESSNEDGDAEDKLVLDISKDAEDSPSNITIWSSENQTLWANGTKVKNAKKISCRGRNITDPKNIPRVQLMNATQLMKKLSLKNETEGNCATVLFYAPWCMFSAQAAPHYNALARAFPQLDVMAIDAFQHSGLNARFGTVAVPSVLVFHNSKAVARFNHTDRNLSTFISFVKNITGLAPNSSVELTEEDYDGPLPSTPEPYVDYFLIISWVFVIVVFSVMLLRSSVGLGVWRMIASLGQEHEHIE